ncbi:MAG: hypothetical protein BAJALOKI2v1_380009 [Promethearchaeota archaeon]|nr:MAG: hypothetical protein BAJALOKI2v1_380009 [Candidatus Lokiarchaeota archaeon]
MELACCYFDESSNLFVELNKDEEEQEKYVPDTVSRLNLKFEICKTDPHDNYQKNFPSLISVKDLFFSPRSIAFSIDLDRLVNPEELQIHFLQLTIFLESGRRERLTLNQKLDVAEIEYMEDCYSGFEYKAFKKERIKKTRTEEKVYHEVERDLKNQKEKSRTIYHKNTEETIKESETVISVMKEGNERLRAIEEQLRTLTTLMKNMNFSGASYSTGPPRRSSSQDKGILPIKRKTPKKTGMPSKGLVYISELKTVLKKGIKENNEFNVNDILKPMSDDELKQVTLDEDELTKKQEEFLTRQLQKEEKKKKPNKEKEGNNNNRAPKDDPKEESNKDTNKVNKDLDMEKLNPPK